MLVSVYGTLREGLRNNDCLKGAEYLGKDILSGFLMFDLGCFPGVIKYKNGEIVVEVYKINYDILSDLDRLESVGYLYDRDVVETSFGPSYIYTIISPWGLIIGGGDYKQYQEYIFQSISKS
jgi:gamma-glutamylcyclotransferase (GGCT)/AIG2-like uncharacterized protein YtfP